MLFNSYHFILIFLPIVLVGYQIAGWIHAKAAIAWLALASLAFYAHWRPALLYVLVSSILFNYLAASLMNRRIPNRVSSRTWLILAITVNLAALCYYKYLFPSLNFMSSAVGSSHRWTDVILPLGISFFTFTQLAFLIDLHQGLAEHRDLTSYALFVTFFPHLIAGPILHHKEMMPQFHREGRHRLNLQDLTVGFSWFVMGLGKKVLFADKLFAPIANPIFNTHETLTPGTAWTGALGYALQMYFDFSGYSDMALGLARMFSIDFPLNFNSPFKAASIIDFWQRWHMTLTRYITAYLYTPVQLWVRSKRQQAGKGVTRRDMLAPAAFTGMVAFPMIFTMGIAGLWHGAGLQFIVFGLLHGIYLTVNHAWRLLRKKSTPAFDPNPLFQMTRHACSVLATFLCVLVSFIVFRARSVKHAAMFIAAMVGGHHRSATFMQHGLNRLALGFAIVWLLPNTQQILGRFKPSLEKSFWQPSDVAGNLLWAPRLGWAFALGMVFFCALVAIQDPSTFLYFQF